MTTELSPDESILEAEASGADSTVIQVLRAQNKELARKAKAAEDAKQSAIEDARQAIQREVTAQQLVSELGYPKLAPLVIEKVQGDLTAESVGAFLEGFGLAPQAGAGGGEKPQPVTGVDPVAVAGIASLGAQLAAAVRDVGGKSVTDRLATAESAEDVDRIAAEAGLLIRY